PAPSSRPTSTSTRSGASDAQQARPSARSGAKVTASPEPSMTRSISWWVARSRTTATTWRVGGGGLLTGGWWPRWRRARWRLLNSRGSGTHEGARSRGDGALRGEPAREHPARRAAELHVEILSAHPDLEGPSRQMHRDRRVEGGVSGDGGGDRRRRGSRSAG